jgi:hypothetical protein
MKRFRFVNPTPGGTKDPNWFSKVSAMASKSNEKENESSLHKIKMANGITKEDDKQIAISLIPQYIQRQKELRPQYEHIRQVGQELKHLKKEYNIADVRQAKPLQVTSFMTLTST